MTDADPAGPAERPKDSPTGVWYSVEAGARSGPWSLGAIEDRRAAKLITDDSLVWTEGMPNWERVADVFAPEGGLARAIAWPGAAPLPPGIGAEDVARGEVHELSAGPPEAEVARARATHPWRRWFARILDVWCTSLIVGVVLAATGRDIPGGQVGASVLLLLVQVPIEAAYLSALGTTPGKALLNIRVREADGTRLSWPRALTRAFSVWLVGMCAGIPFASLFTMSRQHGVLVRDGVTTYDAQGGYVVTQGPVGTGRKVTVALLILMVVGLVAIGLTAQGAAGVK